VIEEGLEHYGMDIHVTGLTELLAKHLVKPQEGGAKAGT
jgi:hypothetical protein